MEGKLKVAKKKGQKKKWFDGYGKIDDKKLFIYENAMCGGEPLVPPVPLESCTVRRGLDSKDKDAPKVPAGEENCQFFVTDAKSGSKAMFSAPSFGAATDWISAVKSQMVRRRAATTKTPVSKAGVGERRRATTTSANSTQSIEDVCQVLIEAAKRGPQPALRATKQVQACTMAALKSSKAQLSLLDDTKERRDLEGAVSELAGCLKQLVGAIRTYSETGGTQDRAKLIQLARSTMDSGRQLEDAKQAVRALSSSPRNKGSPPKAEQGFGGSSGDISPRSSEQRGSLTLGSRRRSPSPNRGRSQTTRDSVPNKPSREQREMVRATQALAAAVKQGPKKAIAATKSVQASCMARLRSAKATMEKSSDLKSRRRMEQAVANMAAQLKSLVAAIRGFSKDPSKKRDIERLLDSLEQAGEDLDKVS